MKLIAYILLIASMTVYSAFAKKTVHASYPCPNDQDVAEVKQDFCNTCVRYCGEQEWECTMRLCINGKFIYETL